MTKDEVKYPVIDVMKLIVERVPDPITNEDEENFLNNLLIQVFRLGTGRFGGKSHNINRFIRDRGLFKNIQVIRYPIADTMKLARALMISSTTSISTIPVADKNFLMNVLVNLYRMQTGEYGKKFRCKTCRSKNINLAHTNICNIIKKIAAE